MFINMIMNFDMCDPPNGNIDQATILFSVCQMQQYVHISVTDTNIKLACYN